MQENEKQREYWNGVVGQNWAARNEQFERGFTHITTAAMTFAALKPGMNVLDVGCGAGTTTAQIARAVAPGKVVGIDISAPLLAVARAGSTGEFVEADASDYQFKPEFDLVFSRFGVMFFADPVRAFANLRMALKPGGRLAFICWRPLEEIPSLWETYTAARDLLPPIEPTPPGAPGPFGLADGDRTRRLLQEAGFHDVTIEKVQPLSVMGRTLEEAVDQALNLGPLAHGMRDMDEAGKAKIRERIRPVLAKFQTEEGIAPPAACWLAGAKA
jgi:SAM-dependent methyltransferase